MDRYSELRARAVEFVGEWVKWGDVGVLAPVRAAADEVALQACADALVGVHRHAFREFVLELSAPELNRRGLKPREDLGGHTRSFHIKDPDGFDVQLQGPLPT